MSYSGVGPNFGNLSSQAASSVGGTSITLDYTVGSASSVLFILGGVPQSPNTDFTVSGTTMTLTTSSTGVPYVIYFLGLKIDIGVPADGVIAKAKITTTLIHEHVDTTITAADSVLFSDATGSNANKKDTVQGILDLVPAAGITIGTAVASTSGNAIDYTGIPSGTKRITLNASGLSGSGGSIEIIQLGDSAGFETSGYVGMTMRDGSDSNSTGAASNYTNGFRLLGDGSDATTFSGRITMELLDASTFTWTATVSMGRTDVYGNWGAGAKSLSAELTQIRLTTVAGNEAFDAGKVNIQYE